MFNIQQAMNFMSQMRNPQQILQKMGIPQQYLNSPDNAMKYLIDSGRVTQDQVNSVINMVKQFNR